MSVKHLVYDQYFGVRRLLSAFGIFTPMAVLKQAHILKWQSRFKLVNFIETGTYMGQTCAVVHRAFKHSYTIEIDEMLFTRAQKKFNNKPITVLHGDSEKQLDLLLPSIKESSMFWLDAHASGGVTGGASSQEVPLALRELAVIAKYYVPGSVILIDDCSDYEYKDLVKALTNISSRFTIDLNSDLNICQAY